MWLYKKKKKNSQPLTVLTQHAWDFQESIKSCETEEKVQFRLRIFLIAKAELGTRQFFAASRLNCSVSSLLGVSAGLSILWLYLPVLIFSFIKSILKWCKVSFPFTILYIYVSSPFCVTSHRFSLTRQII